MLSILKNCLTHSKLNVFHSFILIFVLCKKFFDNFHILFNELNINLDIIAITESRIRENVSCPINIQVPNYSIEHQQVVLRQVVLFCISIADDHTSLEQI